MKKRIKKKKAKKALLIYPVDCIPDGFTFNDVNKLFRKGEVYYKMSLSGKPRVIGGNPKRIKFIQVP